MTRASQTDGAEPALREQIRKLDQYVMLRPLNDLLPVEAMPLTDEAGLVIDAEVYRWIRFDQLEAVLVSSPREGGEKDTKTKTKTL